MTIILVRKLLRDVRPAFIAVSVILFAFAMLWVKITQRVTTEIAPMFKIVSTVAMGDPKRFENLMMRGPSKVSQAALGWGEINFERPTEFLSIGMLHPVVLILSVVWCVGRGASAVAGELDRGTMELLMSQPVPRNRLLLAHLIVDCVVLPALCLAFFAGTQFGLATAGPFVPNYTALDEIPQLKNLPRDTTPLDVSGMSEITGLVNTLALMFAISGMTLAMSAFGRSRWKVVGFAVLVLVVMFVGNTIGQLWEPAGFVRPLTFFYYYQPQRAMIADVWTVDLNNSWNLGGSFFVPAVGVLFTVGGVGYAIALRTFTRRDLPAPL
ncbi:ABC-2 family transporter protein [Gemmata sp. SH-PL17]|uniref:ABC transporter permease subunit n=1 Tax=Gemmata sp. SH-PL17 TaxID=1630693 RepID=UPI00078EC7F9|nr:ABC transporter permease subunit [Gemmata sp. SH-PL17]AMV29065.1 ABC-2 family transporter protein [Gemmata sp. SH-PL17]